MSTAVNIARSAPIETEMARRGYQLHREGRDYRGACPLCGGSKSSTKFSVSTTKNLFHCFGCDAKGDVITLVRELDGVGFLDAVETLAGKRPERGERAIQDTAERERQRREQEEQAARKAEQSTAYAMRVWGEGSCVWDTPAHAYLASRRCDGMFPPDRDPVFRFHQRCTFGGEYLPCLLTLLRNIETDQPQAVHRTALTPDGQKIDRKMLGPKAGAAIKLWPQSCIRDRLVIGEGIESVLGAALHINDHGSRLDPAWSMVDSGGVKSLQPINGVNTLVVLVDNDANGAGQKAAQECAQRWNTAGRKVVRLTPKNQDTDFNDVIVKGNSNAA